MFAHVTIWVDPTQGISYKQIFYEPSGDNRTATYTNIRYNQPIARAMSSTSARHRPGALPRCSSSR